jgi:hypothetical protein
MNNVNQLKDRIEARRHELQSRLHDLRADGRADLDEERTALERKLDDLKETLREGWESASDKLERWLKN